MRWTRRVCSTRDRGSAVAEFVMVVGLLLFIALGVFQLGLALYVRNALISAASEGARFGARADSGPAAGAVRATALITSGLSERFAGDVSARERDVAGVRVIEVTVRAPLPVIGPIGPEHGLTVRGRAFSERQILVSTP